MKIEQLMQMVEIRNTQSFTKAASKLFISQPNLSTSIRALEEELNTRLVVRNNRGACLTSEGERFVEYAESILAQFDRLKELYKPTRDLSTPSLTLANMRFRFAVAAAATLRDRHSEKPFDLVIREASRDGVVNLVSKGESELGLISFMLCYKKELLSQLKASNLQYYRLTANPVSIVVGPNNPLFNSPDGTRISIDMLSSFPQIRYNDADFSHFSDKRERLNIPYSAGEIVVDSRAAMFELIEHTSAYLLATSTNPVYRHAPYYPNIRSFEIAGESLVCELGWIKRSDHTPSPLAMEYLQLLTDYLS